MAILISAVTSKLFNFRVVSVELPVGDFASF